MYLVDPRITTDPHDRLSFLGFAINLSSCHETLEIGQIMIMTVYKKCLIK